MIALMIVVTDECLDVTLQISWQEALIDIAAKARFEPKLPDAVRCSNGSSVEQTGRSVSVHHACS